MWSGSEIMGQSRRGFVSAKVADRGFGFVDTTEGDSYFFHLTDLSAELEFEAAQEGLEVEFEVKRTPVFGKAGAATNVRPADVGQYMAPRLSNSASTVTHDAEYSGSSEGDIPLGTTLTGHVSWVNEDNRFGFIVADDQDGGDVEFFLFYRNWAPGLEWHEIEVGRRRTPVEKPAAVAVRLLGTRIGTGEQKNGRDLSKPLYEPADETTMDEASFEAPW